MTTWAGSATGTTVLPHEPAGNGRAELLVQQFFFVYQLAKWAGSATGTTVLPHEPAGIMAGQRCWYNSAST
jgi:hypothetical protein